MKKGLLVWYTACMFVFISTAVYSAIGLPGAQYSDTLFIASAGIVVFNMLILIVAQIVEGDRMKIVVQTRYRENYGAHDWDGQGECPQHWKNKGGDTYILEGVTVEQAQDHMLWELLKDHISYFNDFSEEIIRGMFLEDDCEPNSNFHEKWESPVILMLRDDNTFAAKRITNPEYPGEWGEYAQKRETWIQRNGERDDYLLIYERNDGSLCDWQGNVLEEAA